MGWFSKSIDPVKLNWMLDHYHWLICELGGWPAFLENKLLLPVENHFPVAEKDELKRAKKLFFLVKKYMRVANWPCRLELLDDEDGIIQKTAPNLAHSIHTKGAAGIFSFEQNKIPKIYYSPRQLNNPVSLIATFSHELCHYHLATIATDPPGGWNEHEYITDLAAVFFGFGVFMCNSAFQFQQFQDGQYYGWSTSAQGYLDEEELSLALAIFCILRKEQTEEIICHLSTNTKSYFKKYLKALKKKHMNEIEAIKNKLQTISSRKYNIDGKLDFRKAAGLGAEVWNNINADEYVKKEREDWDS